MAFKIKHISTRFLLQSIFTILIISTLISIMFYSGYRKKDTLTAQQLISDIKGNLVVAELNLDKAFDQQKGDKLFAQEGADEIIVHQNEVIANTNSNIQKLKDLKYLEAFMQNSELPDSLIKINTEYSLLFAKTIFSLKEKGNVYKGGIYDMFVAIEELQQLLDNAPDGGMQAAEFNTHVKAYKSSMSKADLINLQIYCDEVVNPFYFFEDYDVMPLQSAVNTLRTKLSVIKSIDTRLFGENGEGGQVGDLEVLKQAGIVVFRQIDADVNLQTQKYHQWWIWVLSIIALVLTTAYVVVMGRFSSLVTKSVRKLHKVTLALSNGDIRDTVPEGGRYEFKAYNRELKSLIGHLNKRKEFIEELLNDNFEAELEINSEKDVIAKALVNLKAKLKQAQDEQLSINQEASERRYINEGLAKFGDIMRENNHDTGLLADIFVAELVKYMEAQQGVLFIIEEEDKDLLQLAAAFAFDRKKYLQKTLRKGDGLIGTCAIEQKTICLDQIPEDYTLIRSGLGDTPPRNLLILPIMTEGEVVGVIEIASLKAFSDIEVELAEQIASNLATTIIGTRINSKTAELLKKSQEQAAEMAEQEEEMRQNMEELQATQEESSRREEETQGLLDAIGRTFYVMEYDLSGKIIHVNDRLLEFLEQTADHVLYHSHQEVLSSDSLLSEAFVREIIEKNTPKNTEEVLNWGSKKYKYTYSLTPVLNYMGEVSKVLNLFSIQELDSEN